MELILDLTVCKEKKTKQNKKLDLNQWLNVFK